MGRPEIRFHDLRHAFATNLFHQSVPVKDVSATLGHSTEAFTMRGYRHVLPHVSACRWPGRDSYLRVVADRCTEWRSVCPQLPQRGSGPRDAKRSSWLVGWLVGGRGFEPL
jgi:Phage integrase family